jgi:putative tryptophan/tyrosine transport system substrate-binding protein
VSGISRRDFVQGAGAAGLGLLTACGRLPGTAPSPAKVPRIGVLAVSADPADPDNEGFRQGLRDLGYVEGQNVALEWRPFGSRVDQLPELVVELAGLPVDLIVAHGGTATGAAKQAAGTIPVVMAYTNDPDQVGLVASLAHPGGNVTGMAAMTRQLVGKRLELLRDTLPGLARVAMLWNPATIRGNEFEDFAAAAQTLGLESVQSVELRDGSGLEPAFASILRGRADALFLQGAVVVTRYHQEIVDFSIAQRLPTSSSRRDFAVAGSLMSYGPDYAQMNRRAAYYVDRILKGTQPADLPVEQPTRFELVINLKTAQALGLSIPQQVLLQATEVLQ